MGGDHGHHHKYEVPDYRIYKVEDCPQLVKVQRALAQKGLKDPWLRYVHIFIKCTSILRDISNYDYPYMRDVLSFLDIPRW
jgi:hypothetical protein